MTVADVLLLVLGIATGGSLILLGAMLGLALVSHMDAADLAGEDEPAAEDYYQQPARGGDDHDDGSGDRAGQ